MIKKIAFLIFACCFAGLITAKTTEVTISETELQRLTTVIADIKQHYVKQVSEEELFDNAINGMLAGLDPHSSYLKGDDLKNLELLTIGKFGGIGIEVVPDNGLLKVISPIDGSPAEKAGIKAGDVIIQINRKLVKDMPLNEAVSLMRGPKNSKVTLTILRKDQPKPLTFNLTRDVIKIQGVKTRLLVPDYGYIRIAFFQEPTPRDLRKAIDSLKRENKKPLKGLVLDMRNNPGGLFEPAIQVADAFLDPVDNKTNHLIVYTKGRDDDTQITAKATYGSLLPNVPIVVLINEGTASAAEIVAGALQDHKRAIIAGHKSFGKGSVQTLIPIDKKSAIKLTTALYYTPLGNSIQAKGITPDVIINDVKIPTKNNQSFEPTIDEASLVDHIQNGNGDTDENIKQNHAALDLQQNHELALAHKDYQLYEALHLLEGLNAINQ